MKSSGTVEIKGVGYMSQKDILAGKYDDLIIPPGSPPEVFDALVHRGLAAIPDAIQKGVLRLEGDGRMVMNRDMWPAYQDPLSQIRTWMMAPRVLYSDIGQTETQLIPQHPLDVLQKATLTTGDTGAYNAIFSAVAIIQEAIQQNTHAAMPKRPYVREGFRLVSSTGVSSIGTTEGGSVPTAVEPTYVEGTGGLKDLAVATEMSTRLELVSTRNDTITFGGNLQVIFAGYMNQLDKDLLQDCNTLAGTTIESIDRATTTTACAVTGHGYDAGDEDIYSIDRSSVSYFNGNADHNSNVDRPLEVPYVDALWRDQMPYWGTDVGNKGWFTGPDTWVDWSLQEGTKQRFDQSTVQYTYTQGVQPIVGQAGGFKVATYNTAPVIVDYNVTQDTKSRIYLLDFNHIGIVVGRPIDIITGNHPVYLGSFVNRAVIYSIQELWMDLAAANGALWDLS